MSLSQETARQLPDLRRFARSIAGSQDRGDACVVSLLQTLISENPHFSEADIRVGLYRMMLLIYYSKNFAAPKVSAGQARLAADEHLAVLTPRSRTAFLLRWVEGFSVGEVADILLTDTAGVTGLLDDAGRQLSAQLATDVLIIEDEPLISMDLAELVVSLGHRVAAVVKTRKDAVEAAKLQTPGLILADVNLEDGGSGLDAANDILMSASVPIIFITAYPESVLTGQRPEPTFLIAKPYNPETVKATISQALFFKVQAARTS